MRLKSKLIFHKHLSCIRCPSRLGRKPQTQFANLSLTLALLLSVESLMLRLTENRLLELVGIHEHEFGSRVWCQLSFRASCFMRVRGSVTIWHTLKWTAWKRTYECSGHWHSLRSWFVSWAEHKLKAAIAPDSQLADLPVPASPDNIINARFKVSGGIQPLGKPLLYELLQEGEAGQLGQEGLNSGIKFPRNCHSAFLSFWWDWKEKWSASPCLSFFCVVSSPFFFIPPPSKQCYGNLYQTFL